jgi:hypothetical protein
MKFKSPGHEPLMIGLTSGHTMVVEPDGTDVPPKFRKKAIAEGCIPVGMGTEEVELLPDETKRAELIRAGIDKMLNGTDEGAFGKDGKPNLKKLCEAIGFEISKSERDEAWAAFEDSLSNESEAPQE